MPGPTPKVVQMSNVFRSQLLARERSAANAMVRYYGETWRRIRDQVTNLEAEVQALLDAGEDVTVGKLWRLERLQSIQQQVQDELALFVDFADPHLRAGLEHAIAAGDANARELLLAGFPPGSVSIAFDRMSREAVEALVGFAGDGTPLRNLLIQTLGPMTDQFFQSLVSGLAMGWNPRRLARTLRDDFGMGLDRALRIARTEMLRAWRTSTLAAYRKSGMVLEWERIAAHDHRTCLACLLLDGTRYPLEREMEDHVNGRCALLPVTPSYASMGIDAPEPDFHRELGRDWFLAQPPGLQRDMMGAGRFDLWKQGLITLDQIPHKREDPVWGDSWVPKPLYLLKQENGIEDDLEAVA